MIKKKTREYIPIKNLYLSLLHQTSFTIIKSHIYYYLTICASFSAQPLPSLSDSHSPIPSSPNFNPPLAKNPNSNKTATGITRPEMSESRP